MTRYLDFEGQAAIELILTRAAHRLARLWDGGNERVGLVARADPPDASGDTRAAFVNRVEVVCQLRRASLRANPARARRIDEITAKLEMGAPERGVHCLLIGFGNVALVEIEAAAMRNYVAAELLTNDDILTLFYRAATRTGALIELRQLRHRFFEEAGAELGALHLLERTIDEDWDNISAVAIAVGRARSAAEPLLATTVGHRARIFFTMMAEAAVKRLAGGVNSPGGAA